MKKRWFSKEPIAEPVSGQQKAVDPNILAKQDSAHSQPGLKPLQNANTPDEESNLSRQADPKPENMRHRRNRGTLLLERLGLRQQLQSLRERIEPIIESRFEGHQNVVQKLDVLLRGGRPRPFALVGASGTGKSFRALLFAENHNIPYLIDDGILIEGGRIVAGQSAKNELIYIKAIKTALFDSPEHLAEVCQAIKENKVQRILLVGTSVRMVRLVAERLGLPKIADSDITHIEEISSPEEIEQARKSRSSGHHIIPVPAVEVSREYSNLIRDGFQIFLSDLRMGMKHYLKKKIRRRPKGGKKERIFEKTVVKPQFMKRALEDVPQGKKTGRIQITENALRQMIVHCIDEYSQDIWVQRIKIRISRTSYKVKIFITLPLRVIKGQDSQNTKNTKGVEGAKNSELNSYLYKLQNYVVNSLHRHAGVALEELSIEVLEFI
ncbi:hypothetical protein P0082_09560 [Candidatus Haliotispira prima]|uniref:Uncharacterized protein n=1 Tax=Candidatus Haliotispira prima TaxID=3034016 RepID=A0ABY8MFH7_9SPIO|nr:hypothetical protein P0082_09560 [Candidatus Haliotispira prima]